MIQIIYGEMMMFNQEKNLKNSYEYLNALNIVFYLVISIPIVAFGIIYLRAENAGGMVAPGEGSFHIVYHLIIPLLTLLCLAFAFISYRKKMKQQPATGSLPQKLLFFYQVSVQTYLIFLVAGLLPLISLYFTKEQPFAGLYAISLVASSFKRPILARVVRDLKLNPQEKQRLASNEDLKDA